MFLGNVTVEDIPHNEGTVFLFGFFLFFFICFLIWKRLIKLIVYSVVSRNFTQFSVVSRNLA